VNVRTIEPHFDAKAWKRKSHPIDRFVKATYPNYVLAH
jgi:hypothetical protein